MQLRCITAAVTDIGIATRAAKPDGRRWIAGRCSRSVRASTPVEVGGHRRGRGLTGLRMSAGRALEQKEISGRRADEDVRIARRPEESAATPYDLVVVGGGIDGIALAFEASRRGYRAVLLERADFGGGTSWSSLRIIHGGLRYLQSLNVRRFRESVAERRWFLRHFPSREGEPRVSATALVTGANGFTGSWFCRYLAQQGTATRGMYWAPDSEPDFAHPNLELVPGDLRDRASPRRALDGIEVVCNIAAVHAGRKTAVVHGAREGSDRGLRLGAEDTDLLPSTPRTSTSSSIVCCIRI